MARFQDLIRDFTAGKSGSKKFLMVDAYQPTKPLIQAEQLAGQNANPLFNDTSRETIPMWNIHHGSFLRNKRASRAQCPYGSCSSCLMPRTLSRQRLIALSQAIPRRSVVSVMGSLEKSRK